MNGKEYKNKLMDEMFPDGRAHSGNPMVRKFGPDKKGRKCKDCKYLTMHECSKRYYKCELRGVTHGKATDHGKYYPACSKIELEEN